MAAAQHELGMKFEKLTSCADNMQIYKYVVHQVAHAYGKILNLHAEAGLSATTAPACTATCRSGTNGEPTFAGNQYADLSETCLYFIGGILKHAKALNAFTNPSTNSYKRLVPGYEAPVLLAYSSRNRSASCRIPFTASPKAKAR